MIRNLCAAAIRLIALFFGASAASHLLAFAFWNMEVASPSGIDNIFFPSYILVFAHLSLSIVLWFSSTLITRVIVPLDENRPNFTLNSQDLLLIGLCLVGALALIQSIPELVEALMLNAYNSAQNINGQSTEFEVRVRYSPSILESSIRNIIGFGLLLFGFRLKSVVRKFQALRTAGLEQAEPTSSSERSERS